MKYHVVNYFLINDYMVRATPILIISQDICNKPLARKGKTLNSEIKNIISNFYCDNENTRIVPGATWV